MSQIPKGATHWSSATDDRNEAYWRPNGDGYDCYCPSWIDARWQGISDSLPDYATPIESAWTGEGEPPVGTVCEFNGGAPCPDDPWHPDLQEGDQVTIIAYFNDSVGRIAAFTFKARNENIAAIQVEQARPGAFRPIRTPEQIAAEERDAALNQMVRSIKDHPNKYPSVSHLDQLKIQEDACIDLYDAGLRFEVNP